MEVGASASSPRRVACATTLVGITLPAGFCAIVYADTLGATRHMTVAPNGDVFVAVSNRQNAPGGVIALRDSDHDGQADVRRRWHTAGSRADRHAARAPQAATGRRAVSAKGD